MKAKKLAALLLALLLTAPVAAACAQDKGSADTGKDSGSESGSDSAQETEFEYQYEESDFGEYTFRILNSEPIWGQYTAMDFEADAGDGLDSAVYRRARMVEDKLNIRIQETQYHDLWNYTPTITNTILADEDAWDIVMASEWTLPGQITGGCYMNLLDVDGLQLDQPWWDQDMQRSLSINGRLYSATGAINLMVYDGTCCLIFNKAMMENLQLDLPYDAVRDGKWTWEQLLSYVKAANHINGTDADTYGINVEWPAIDEFLRGFDMRYFEADGDGDFIFVGDNDRTINIMETLAEAFRNGDFQYGKQDSLKFGDGNLLFSNGSFSTLTGLRSSDLSFGVAPYPKWDETQDRYASNINIGTVEYTIPVTNPDPERTAIISDMLAYYGYRDVLPEYYTNYLFIKGMRDQDDDVEMLQLISSVRGVETAVALQWIGDFQDWHVLPAKIGAGETGYASLIASKRDIFVNNMEDMIAELYS